MKLVIDLPEYLYDRLHDLVYDDYALNDYELAVFNGTPLPKGHGRLIDVSDLMPDSDYEDGLFYAVSIGQINLAPTIIEADKSESEE